MHSSPCPVTSRGKGHSHMMVLEAFSSLSPVTSRDQGHNLMMVLDENRNRHSK